MLVASGAAEKFSALLDRLPAEAELTQVPDRLFESVAQTQSPQGIAALVELPAYKLEQIVAAPKPLLVVACRLQDPGNLGTMMRTALAFSASAFLTLQETVSPFNPKAVRSSAGAIFRLPLVCGLDPQEALPFLSVHVRIVAAERNSPASLAQADLKGPIAILVGTRSHRIAGRDCPVRQPASEHPHPEGSGFPERGDRGEHLSLRGSTAERIQILNHRVIGSSSHLKAVIVVSCQWLRLRFRCSCNGQLTTDHGQLFNDPMTNDPMTRFL